MKRPKPTEETGRIALRDHIREKALVALSRHSAPFDNNTAVRLTSDRDIVRYPTQLVYDGAPLEPGEFAFLSPKGDDPIDGFVIYLRPDLADRPTDALRAVLYQIVRINYGDIATSSEAELFGSTAMGESVDDYYNALCQLSPLC